MRAEPAIGDNLPHTRVISSTGGNQRAADARKQSNITCSMQSRPSHSSASLSLVHFATIILLVGTHDQGRSCQLRCHAVRFRNASTRPAVRTDPLRRLKRKALLGRVHIETPLDSCCRPCTPLTLILVHSLRGLRDPPIRLNDFALFSNGILDSALPPRLGPLCGLSPLLFCSLSPPSSPPLCCCCHPRSLTSAVSDMNSLRSSATCPRAALRVLRLPRTERAGCGKLHTLAVILWTHR